MDTALRAIAARDKIMAEVAAGRFRLVKYSIYLYPLAGEGRCAGCALGALAFSLNGATGGSANPNSVDHCLRESCVKTGTVTLDDVKQLEMGYEGWTSLGQAAGYTKADADHPFHQLGRDLRSIAILPGDAR